MSAATENQLRLFEEISNEIQNNVLGYVNLKDKDGFVQAQSYLQSFRQVLLKMNDSKLTAKKASEYIKEACLGIER